MREHQPNDPHETFSSDWSACPDGLLTELSAAARSRDAHSRSGRRWLAVGGTTAMLAVIALLVWYAPIGGGGADRDLPRYGGLICREVLEDADRYFAKDMAEQRSQRIERHLQDCPHCKRRYSEVARRLGVEWELLSWHTHQGASDGLPGELHSFTSGAEQLSLLAGKNLVDDFRDYGAWPARPPSAAENSAHTGR